ncbi:MAG: class II fructose-bisphosphate aldolase [Gammaproteobacteria bacterium]|nr:class II fructose-bisphosphate aldolase [Gammaproteobacteria bacterium]
MALVNMRDLLYHAYRQHYAVGAFDIVSLDFLQGVLRGAEASRAPVILNFVVPQFGDYDFELLVAAALAGARRSPVPVALNLDHAPDLDCVVYGIRHGCNGVMIDGSRLPFERNVELTRSVVQTAHGCGIAVEGELGIVADYAEDALAAGERGVYTWPDEARQYVRQTKVDFLAVSIGTGHGMRSDRYDLDLERLTRINKAVGIPLVIHGGSGLSDAQYECLIDRGVARINYYSGLSQIAARRLRSNCLVKRTGGVVALGQGVVEAIGKEVERCLSVWGAAGRAGEVLAEAAPWNEVEHLILYNSTEDAARVEEMMAEGRRVLGAIPGVRRVYAGRALKDGAKYRYCWLVRFAHPDVVDSYRDHPDHVAFAETRFRPSAAPGRISIDYLETASGDAAPPREVAAARRRGGSI